MKRIHNPEIRIQKLLRGRRGTSSRVAWQRWAASAQRARARGRVLRVEPSEQRAEKTAEVRRADIAKVTVTVECGDPTQFRLLDLSGMRIDEFLAAIVALRGRPLELVQQSTSRKSGKLSGVLTRDPGGS